jgi:Fe-S cluster assembly protein SufD
MQRDLSPAETTLSSFFDQRKGDAAAALRESAWREFVRRGLPNKRVESWHYTDLRAALREIAPPAPVGGGPTRVAAPGNMLRLALGDGAFQRNGSNLDAAPEGVLVQSLREALAQGDAEVMAALAPQTQDAAVALNAALMQDGVVLRIAPGAHVAQPIELLSLLSGGGSVFTRSLVLIGTGARATILERTQPSACSGAQINHAVVMALGDGARVEHVARLYGGAPGSVGVSSLIATLGAKSSLNSCALTCFATEGGGLLRRQIFARLVGAEAEIRLAGANYLRGNDHADTTLVVRHEAPGGRSREMFRYILDDAATGVFQGRISVARAAQKTDGAMQSKALLLSDCASMNNKPELEIFADDVLCGHGATCGRLDEDQLFYLTARGIPKCEAEALLIAGFANEAVADVADEALREALSEEISGWLTARTRFVKAE